MFSYRKTASCGAAVLASCISLLAQGQPNAKESRRVGLDVLGIQQTVVNGAQGGVTLTVHAPAGSVYDLAFEGSVASADLHLVVPGVLGTFALNPTSTAAVWFYGAAATSPPAGVFGVPMASFFVDPNGGMPGVIPAGATSQTLVSTFETQVGAVATFQALVVEPFAPGGAPTYRVTNGQQRFIVPPALTLATSGFTTGQGALINGGATPLTSHVLRDVEQGDIDGDGDMDEVIVGSPANGWTVSEVQSSFNPAAAPPYNAPIRTTYSFVMATGVATRSAELVDLDADGVLDMVIGGVGPTPGNNFAAYRGSAPWPGLLVPLPIPVQFDAAFAGQPMDVTDVDVGDLNGDGLPDVYLTCGSSICGQAKRNRLFIGSTAGGTYSLIEATRTAFDEVFDNSQDAELFDLEGDGDLDIVVANAGGPTSTFGGSVNLIHRNNGGLNFTTIPDAGPHDNTMDVLAVDIDLNGLDDLYYGNSIVTDSTCVGLGFAPDRLLLNGVNPSAGFGPGTFRDVTHVIVTNDWATKDAEGVSIPTSEIGVGGMSARDFDGDGDVDILLGLGSGGEADPWLSTPLVGRNRGMVVLINQMAEVGNPPGGELPMFVMASYANTDDVSDLELGDWFLLGQPFGRWFEKDVGVATRNNGHRIHSKNQ